MCSQIATLIKRQFIIFIRLYETIFYFSSWKPVEITNQEVEFGDQGHDTSLVSHPQSCIVRIVLLHSTWEASFVLNALLYCFLSCHVGLLTSSRNKAKIISPHWNKKGLRENTLSGFVKNSKGDPVLFLHN